MTYQGTYAGEHTITVHKSMVSHSHDIRTL